MKRLNKIVLAYSGGLDTSVIIPWLRENYGSRVIAFTADLGQGKDFGLLKKRAIKSGAYRVYVKDLREKFAKEYVLPTLQAGALYEGKYPLATALSRPLIAKEMLKVAEIEKVDGVAHGCSGKGNDQVRFELTFKSMRPDLEIVAPLREWKMDSREDEIDYAKKHKIPVDVKKRSPYSIDSNLWGTSIECGALEDPWREPPEDAFQITKSSEKAPQKPRYIEIDFEKGCPIAVDGHRMGLVPLIDRLNKIGALHGIGRIDMVENRLVGIKSREVYEAPGATILLKAHQELESLVLDRETFHHKSLVSHHYANLIYYGLWDLPLREAIARFVQSTERYVKGRVRVKLYKGSCVIVGRRSPFSMYDRKLATYDKDDVFEHKKSEGFIDLWGLPLEVMASRKKKR